MAKITSNTKTVVYTLELSTYEAALILSLLGACCGDTQKTHRVDTDPIYRTLRKAIPVIQQIIITEDSIPLRKLP